MAAQSKLMRALSRIIAVSPQDKLESVLDVSHQQMEQYRAQPAHTEKIAYQQKLLQEDVVHIRAEISQASTVRQDARRPPPPSPGPPRLTQGTP